MAPYNPQPEAGSIHPDHRLAPVFVAYEGLPPDADDYLDGRDVPPHAGGPVDHAFRVGDAHTVCGVDVRDLDTGGDDDDPTPWHLHDFAACEDCADTLAQEIGEAMRALGWAEWHTGGGCMAWGKRIGSGGWDEGERLICFTDASLTGNPAAYNTRTLWQGEPRTQKWGWVPWRGSDAGFAQLAHPVGLADALRLVEVLPDPEVYPDSDWRVVEPDPDAAFEPARHGLQRVR